MYLAQLLLLSYKIRLWDAPSQVFPLLCATILTERSVIELNRKMAVAEHRIENSSTVPPDSDLFVGEVRRNLSEHEVFVGDEDFYRLLANSSPISPAKQTARKRRSVKEPVRHERYSTLQKVFIAGIIVIEAMLLYIVLKPLLWTKKEIPVPVTLQKSPYTQPVTVYEPVEQQQEQQPALLFTSTEPLSLDIARNFYLIKDYSQAYGAYNQLYQNLPSGANEELIRNFLQLKMALCLYKGGNYEEAKSLFRTLSKSRSPVIRVVSNYNLSYLNVRDKQYLNARTRAYKTIAMINAVDFNKDWIFSLRRASDLLVAESMTRNILSLCDSETDIQSLLWSGPMDIDPFTNLDEGQLRELLNYGSERLRGGLLSPQVRKLEDQGGLPHWSVIACGASVEELLARFVSNIDHDITWIQNSIPGTEMTGRAVRNRPVSMYLTPATNQRVIEVAAGHVGLLSRMDENNRLVKIFDPTEYSSLSEHIRLLIQDTISLWRDFLLKYPNDRHIPNAHFAMGLLHTQEEQLGNAIAEYKLVANQFSQAPLAPYALLNSSKLKAHLRDYAGAREDLTQLVEQYPHTEFYGQACLNLADATRNTGFLDEAERLYRKVYNLGLSSKLQIASTFGAGRCSFDMQDYENASKWLIRYLKLPIDKKDEDFYMAYFLLGKTYLALENPQQAIIAFQYAISGPVGSLSREKYVETVSALVETHIQLENLIDALTLLETLNSWQFSKKESIEILLLKSKVLRLMSLPDKAIIALGDNAEYLPASQLKTRMSFELANCYIAKGDLDFAQKFLSDILMSAVPGPLADEISLRLAEVCLELGQSPQTVTVCRQLLNSGVSTKIKQKALEVLVAAYKHQKKFDSAALALLGQW
jgi:tetratricopeptide (TPR) repeat protein